MTPLIYGELVSWYRLLDPPEDHADEAASFQAALEQAISGPAHTLLELGAGAGHNACHLKRRFRCTLTDLAEPMLDLSRQLNPECEHLPGDMRHLRLGRVFDAVLIHDSIVYMTSEQNLRQALETAFVHTRPGGAALIAPDGVAENFAERTFVIQGDQGERSLRCLEWDWDPDPDDCTQVTDYALLLREHGQVRAVHDRHLVGLFPRATWLRLLAEVGFRVELVPRPIGDGELDEVFCCRRP